MSSSSLSELIRGWLWNPTANSISELHRVLNMNRTELIERLTGIDASLASLNAGVNKIGTETTALKAEIATLTAAVEEASAHSPELDAALSAVQARVEALAVTVQAVDDLVEDPLPPIDPAPLG